MGRTALAAAIGANPYTITRWQRDGLPVADRGGPGRESKYSLPAVIAWRVARETSRNGGAGAVSLEVERAKLANVQTRRAEVELLAKSAQLLPLIEMERVWSAAVAEIRARLLALPMAMAEPCLAAAQTDGAPGIQRMLTAAVRDGLRGLAQWTAPPAPA